MRRHFLSLHVHQTGARQLARLAALVAMACFALPAPAGAQDPAPAVGRITGRVLDAATGTPLPDVYVQVVGTMSATRSGEDGRFTFGNLRPGTVTLHARRLGFEPMTVTGLMLDPGATLVQDFSLKAATVQLTAQVVTAHAERGNVGAALDEQRTATGVVNSVTAEQIAKSGDSDAAQAVQRVSGVTVQDGKYVAVRGLGERYTATTLNGARIPSPEPERKVVPLDLFPSSLLESITTSKNFTPDQPGDFSGAMVNLRTRDFPASREVTYSLSLGANDAVTGRPLLRGHGDALTALGFAGGDRRLPAPVRAAGGFEPAPDRDEMHRLVASFNNRWTPAIAAATPNLGMSVTHGGSARAGGRTVGYVGSVTYSHATEARLDETRAYYDPTGGGTEIDRFSGRTGRTSVLWGGLANVSVMLGGSTRLALNNSYNRGTDDEARSESGYSANYGQRVLVDRLRLVERRVFSSQLVAEHQLSPARRLDWSLTASGVSRNEPDRSEFARLDDGTGRPFWGDGSEMAVRTFGALRERNVNLSADFTQQLGAGELKVGALGRYTTRDAANQVYSLQALDLDLEGRRAAAEEIFAGVDTGSATFRIAPLSQGGSYEAREGIGAAYAMAKVTIGEDLDVVGGARIEADRMEVVAEPTVGQPVVTRPAYTDVLPSLAVNYRVTDRQNLRFSATQTLARPEYRELAEVQYRDVIGGENVLGNPALRRTLIRNADLRWEWYPDAEEVVTVGVFAKRFIDPIERMYLATSGTRMLTYGNAESATNLGLELEGRASLGRLAERLRPVTVFSNVTVMRSEIRIAAGERSVAGRRAMVGQSPYVVNAGATWSSDSRRTSGTLLFNRVGRRISTAGEQGLPSVFEEPRNVLDLSLRFPAMRGLTGKLDLRNLFDDPYLLTQGTVTRERHRTGRTLSLGFSWQG